MLGAIEPSRPLRVAGGRGGSGATDDGALSLTGDSSDSVREPVSIPSVDRRRRRQTSPLARIGFVVFGIGLLAVVVIMVLFATGSHDLPLWLNLVAMLAPVGFGIGLIGDLPRGTRVAPASALPHRRPGPAPPSTGRRREQ